MTDSIGERGELLEMPVPLWHQANLAASMDALSIDEFCSQHLATAAKDRLRREANRQRQAAEPRPYG